MTAQEKLGTKGVPNIRELQYTPWFQNETEIDQGLSVRVGSLPECCVRCITVTRRQNRLPTDKSIAT